MAVKEWRGDILFLHRVVDGPADRSYGIHVARLAGVPSGVCTRAEEILGDLERHEPDVAGSRSTQHEVGGPRDRIHQLDLFRPAAEEVADQLRRLDADRMTPVEALNFVVSLKRRICGED
jgi:DNA mismatch repair protein MutS